MKKGGNVLCLNISMLFFLNETFQADIIRPYHLQCASVIGDLPDQKM